MAAEDATTVTAESPLRLALLRGFELRRRGEVVDIPQGGQRVAAFLALHPRPVHRLLVAGTLWIDSSEDRAGAALRTALWRLSRAAEDLVRCHGSTLALAPGVSVDVRHAAARAQRLIQRPDEHCPQDLELLGTQGDLLPDWYDDWVLIERERFAELRLRALETLCWAFTNVGRFGDAVEAGLAAVACEPLRETANRALIAAYLAEGNKATALRHYQQFRALLSDSLQMVPSDRMEMLIASVRQEA